MLNDRFKIVVTGSKRWGKDTVCEIMQKDFGLTFESSSFFVARTAVEPWLTARGITYPSFEAMYADRVNHREEWYNAICAYNEKDAARLGKEIFSQYDVYCGLRNIRELRELQRQMVVDFVIWVDASKRLPPEDASSLTIGPENCDYIIDNNGTRDELDDRVHAAYEFFKRRLNISPRNTGERA